MGVRTYQLWRDGPWSLPEPTKAKDIVAPDGPKKETQPTQLVSTKNIVENNLFDPERGAGGGPAETSSAARQRIQRLNLVGTVIVGASRYAIFQESNVPSGVGAKAQPTQQPSQMRLKVGDVVDGFRLAEIYDKRVVFLSGSSRVDVTMDFLRKSEDARPPATTPSRSGPAAAPTVPRTERLPSPPVTR